MTQRISTDPSPPKAGETVKICYDFADLQITGTTLEVTFLPSGMTSGQVTPTEPCIDVLVPSDATQMTVHDVDGPSPDLVTAVDG